MKQAFDAKFCVVVSELRGCSTVFAASVQVTFLSYKSTMLMSVASTLEIFMSLVLTSTSTTKPIGNLIFSINGSVYLPDHGTNADLTGVPYIPDIEIEFDIFLHQEPSPAVEDYQILNVGQPDDYRWELPKLLLDTSFNNGASREWLFAWDNPDGFVPNPNYLLFRPTILPLQIWTHIYLRANKYRQYFEEDGVAYFNERDPNSILNLTSNELFGIYIGADVNRPEPLNATMRNIKIYSVSAGMTQEPSQSPTSASYSPTYNPLPARTSPSPSNAPSLLPSYSPTANPVPINTTNSSINPSVAPSSAPSYSVSTSTSANPTSDPSIHTNIVAIATASASPQQQLQQNENSQNPILFMIIGAMGMCILVMVGYGCFRFYNNNKPKLVNISSKSNTNEDRTSSKEANVEPGSNHREIEMKLKLSNGVQHNSGNKSVSNSPQRSVESANSSNGRITTLNTTNGSFTIEGDVETQGQIISQEYTPLRLWLESLNLSQDYLEYFVKHGYEKIEFIQTIDSMEDLRDIGVTNDQDAMRLLQGIDALKSTTTTQNY